MSRVPMSEIIAQKRREQKALASKKKQAETEQRDNISSMNDDDAEVDWDALELDPVCWDSSASEQQQQQGSQVVVVGYDESLSRCHVSNEGRYPERPNRTSRAMDLLRDRKMLMMKNSNPNTTSGKLRAVRRMPMMICQSSDARQGDDATEEDATTPSQDGTEEKDNSKKKKKDTDKETKTLLYRLATLDELHPAVHDGEEFRDFISTGKPFSALSSDLHFDGTSREGALRAAAISIDAAVGVWERKWKHAFALVRPPGHHSGTDKCHGFCLVNNVAAMAAALIRRGARRVAIIDIDVHHGDGTQKICDKINSQVESNRSESSNNNNDKDDDGDSSAPPEILFASMHRYDEGKFFPMSGHPDSFGPRGLNFNIALNTSPGGSKPRYPFLCICDDTVRVVTEEFVVPLLRDAFRPDVVLVSCGFDAAEGDPLGGQGIRNGFFSLAQRLSSPDAIPSSRGVACVLEGGYDVQVVSRGVCDVVRGLATPGNLNINSDDKEEDVVMSQCLPPRVWENGRKYLEHQRQKEQEEEEQKVETNERAEDADVTKLADDEKQQEIDTPPPAPPVTVGDTSDEALRQANESWTRQTLRDLCSKYVSSTSNHHKSKRVYEWCKKNIASQ